MQNNNVNSSTLTVNPNGTVVSGLMSIDIPSGNLELKVCDGSYELSDLCGFAARCNPKRGFLFVSKVIGRYLATRPSTMNKVFATLTDKLPKDLTGPVVVLGVAEAGLALAQCVHRELALARDVDALLIFTTRHSFDREVSFAFEEPHSHAPTHRLYLPEDSRHRRELSKSKTVIIVDDEVTTGKTFEHIVKTYKQHCPEARHFHHLVLTDWSAGQKPYSSVQTSDVSVTRHTLLKGQYWFRKSAKYQPHMPNVVGNQRNQADDIKTNWGRFGTVSPLSIDKDCIPQVEKGNRVLVLGMGEFIGPALLIAEALEKSGVDAWFQSTTRAPVLIGGAIHRVLSFQDSYGEAINNYLYNVGPGDFDQVFLCLETPAHTVPKGLIEALNVRPIFF
jgi:adenine/guanine phosphoribosyltransferase-like PRPP-binding protein